MNHLPVSTDISLEMTLCLYLLLFFSFLAVSPSLLLSFTIEVEWLRVRMLIPTVLERLGDAIDC